MKKKKELGDCRKRYYKKLENKYRCFLYYQKQTKKERRKKHEKVSFHLKSLLFWQA